MRQIHIIHKVVLGLLLLLIIIVTVLFLINKREVSIAESHKKYSLTLNNPMEIPIEDFSIFGHRPLVVAGIFDFPFAIKLTNGEYAEWALQIKITKKGSTETIDFINYSAVQSGFATQLYKFPTDSLSSVSLLLTKLDITGSDKITIDVGREFNIDSRTLDQLLLIPLISLTVLFSIYLLLILRTLKLKSELRL